MNENLVSQIEETKNATPLLANLSTKDKNNFLLTLAEKLHDQQEKIIAANQRDLAAGREKGLSEAMLDRLRLDESRVRQMQQAVEEVASLPDPVGRMSGSEVRPSGIRVCQMQIPLGVILMIYESRPNVTIEASSLCFKSGNAVILRGGSEAIHSNTAIGEVIAATLSQCDLPENLIRVLASTDRAILNDLLCMGDKIDLVIPRGGPSLIEFVSKNSQIPVIQHYKGVCHLYVDESADLEQAVALFINGKAERPSVCNALETCLLHDSIAKAFFDLAAEKIAANKIEIRGCQKTLAHYPGAVEASEDDYYTEFLDTIIAMRVVKDLEAAIRHIQTYGSHHTEVICTENYTRAQEFIRRVDASVVMVNASSRFSDGGELGLGAEIGISTSKLHAYGPMGLDSLTTKKFVVTGTGNIRQ